VLLGIDYGLRNIGLAVSEGDFATPIGTVKVKNVKEALTAVSQIVSKWDISKIVVGVSEGKSKASALAFGTKLKSMLTLPLDYIDETLSSHEARTLRTKNRLEKDKEHAQAAAVILQRWLDSRSEI